MRVSLGSSAQHPNKQLGGAGAKAGPHHTGTRIGGGKALCSLQKCFLFDLALNGVTKENGRSARGSLNGSVSGREGLRKHIQTFHYINRETAQMGE